MTYTLCSIKGSRTVTVDDESEAIALAEQMQAELQSAYGVDVRDADGALIATID